MSETKDLIQVNLLSDLRDQPVSPNARAFMVGKIAVEDGMGGLYRWDPASTAAEDNAFNNVFTSNISATGRWVRMFQRARALPQGVLVNDGMVKRLYINGVTASDGTVSANLTMENTANGTPIFTEIWSNRAEAKTVSTTPGGAVQSFLMEQSTDLKTTKHGFYKANVLTIALGLLYNPFIMTTSGTAVLIRVEGV